MEINYLSSTYKIYEFFQNKNIDPEYRGGGDDDDEHYAFSVAEAIFVGWFTFEYIIRFVAAPQKWRLVSLF